MGDPSFRRIFCLVHAEKLSYQVCDNVMETLKVVSQTVQGTLISIIIVMTLF